MGRPRKPLLSDEEIRRPFTGAGAADVPPILTLAEVAKLLRVGEGTVRDWRLKGRLDGTFRKRGKHLLFWRDKVLHAVFNEAEWQDD